MSPSQIVVKRYKSDKEYQIDAKKMVSRGYEVQSVTSEQPRSGCGRILLIGIFAAIFKPKPVLIVTYRLALHSPTKRQEHAKKEVVTPKQEMSDGDNISKW
mgnify:CR=1 FL=1